MQASSRKDTTREVFKACTSCGVQWPTRDAFLAEPAVQFVGYQAFVQDAVLGLFLFNHEPCGTTLAISASRFEDLREGPVYEQRRGHPDQSSPYCLTASSGGECPPQCECAFVQRVIDAIGGRDGDQDGSSEADR